MCFTWFLTQPPNLQGVPLCLPFNLSRHMPCLRACMCVCILTLMCDLMHVCMHSCVSLCVYVCVSVCVSVCKCVHVHQRLTSGVFLSHSLPYFWREGLEDLPFPRPGITGKYSRAWVLGVAVTWLLIYVANILTLGHLPSCSVVVLSRQYE